MRRTRATNIFKPTASRDLDKIGITLSISFWSRWTHIREVGAQQRGTCRDNRWMCGSSVIAGACDFLVET